MLQKLLEPTDPFNGQFSYLNKDGRTGRKITAAT